MTFQVVHVRRRGGVPAKPVIDLTKKIAPKPINAPPVKAAEKAKPKQPQQPRPVWITAAADGPPIEADLPEKFRKMDAPVPWATPSWLQRNA